MGLEETIKRTIEYSHKYNGKLTKDQLFERLIGSKVYRKEEMEKIITFDKRETFAKEKIGKAKKLAKLIGNNFKDILFLGITGSVAAGYPRKNDDIDLIIITKKDKLWLVRLRLRFFILINRIPHRKFGKKEKKDDFCFNLWIDEDSLCLSKNKQNLKNGVDLILIRPLINKNKIYERFISTNSWAKKWVATGYSLKPSTLINRDTSLKKAVFLDGIINWLVFWPQFWYMKKRIKNEEVGIHKAFFHH